MAFLSQLPRDIHAQVCLHEHDTAVFFHALNTPAALQFFTGPVAPQFCAFCQLGDHRISKDFDQRLILFELVSHILGYSMKKRAYECFAVLMLIIQSFGVNRGVDSRDLMRVGSDDEETGRAVAVAGGKEDRVVRIVHGATGVEVGYCGRIPSGML
jgi:hypothetical protein